MRTLPLATVNGATFANMPSFESSFVDRGRLAGPQLLQRLFGVPTRERAGTIFHEALSLVGRTPHSTGAPRDSRDLDGPTREIDHEEYVPALLVKTDLAELD